MIKSKDGLVEVLVGSSIGSIILPPLAWSIVNVPSDEEEAESLFKNLYNSPTSHHITLAVHRHRKKERVASMGNLALIKSDNWTYLDTVSILYQKPSSSSNNGFLPLAEPGHIFCKGDIPDTSTTAWFNEDAGNATNLWDLGPTDVLDAENEKAYYQKYNNQLNLIMMSMCVPMEYRRFAYLCSVDGGDLAKIYKFCKGLNIGVCLYASTDTEARKMIDVINKMGK